MFKGIQSIKAVNSFNNKVDFISLGGRNLIITGGNGCGKTRFVDRLFNSLFERITDPGYQSDTQLLAEINGYEQALQHVEKGGSDWAYYNGNLPRLKQEWLKRQSLVIKFDNDDLVHLRVSYQAGKSVLLSFPAFRSAQINGISSIRSLAAIKEASKTIAMGSHQMPIRKAVNFEEYLVALKHARAMYISEENDIESARLIELWFSKLEKDLGELFEDRTLQLKYDIKSSSFDILQSNKEPYKFQNLSSGFSAVMCIYAELLMNIEANELKPEELHGIVIIDEIDAHLHISIQKKIMSFLSRSFPLIQFIVTTHSPFVVMSVNDAVIYDLSKHEQVEDLSLYSYEAVAEGLFETSPVSQILLGKMNELISLANDLDKNLEKVRELISILKQHENKLNAESQYYLKNTEINVMRFEKGAGNV
ncbi:AAA family ATPase [Cronobacter dublinensis]